MKRPQIIIHGGAVSDPHYRNETALAFLRDCCVKAHQRLLDGVTSTEAVQIAVREMELSGLFLAGKGAHPNQLGAFELDASIMSGKDASSGAVAGALNARCAIDLAARLRGGKTVMLAGAGIRRALPDDPSWLREDEQDYFQPLAHVSAAARAAGLSTVGAAACDTNGDCASATATSGVIGKRDGRIGDSAIIGAGTWADTRIAASCTGQGEYFIRTAAARSVAARVAFGGQDLQKALDKTVAEIAALGGVGGIIAANGEGVRWAFNSAGLKRAWIDETGAVHANY